MIQASKQSLEAAVSEALIALRTREGKTQTEVASDLHVDRPLLADWERGRVVPSALNLTKLADYYRVPVDFLLGRIGRVNKANVNTITWRYEIHKKATELLDAWQNRKIDDKAAEQFEDSICTSCLKLPVLRDDNLEKKLHNAFPSLSKLENIWVVQVPDDLAPLRKLLVANAAAEMFAQRIKPRDLVAFSGGSIMLSMARFVKYDPDRMSNLQLFTLDSSFLTNQLKLTAAAIIALLQINLKANASAFHIFEQTDAKGAALFKADIHRLTQQLDLKLAFVGVGDPFLAGSYSSSQVSVSNLNDGELKRLQVKAEILLHLIDATGQEIDNDFNRRGAAVPLKVLHEINDRQGLVVGVVAGPQKANALRAVLMGKYLSGIIVDESLAKAL